MVLPIYALPSHCQSEEPGDEDLLDLAAVKTFLNSGNIYAVEPEKVPGGEPFAAVFRY